ncbi:MAG: sulfatase-like hydrolase/transferase, partial [Acidimicrobiales bacterium]
GSTWAPARFPPELSQTTFIRTEVVDWLERHGDVPFFLHASFIRPHPPRRNPLGYHDLYSAEAVETFAGCEKREDEAAIHPLASMALRVPQVGAPEDERESRQLRATYYGAQREVDDGLAALFEYLESSGLSETTLVVVTSDHGEMGGDHWLLEKFGYWDECFHVPLVVRDPTTDADPTRGLTVRAFSESVDVAPTILEWMGLEVPVQFDGWPLTPFLRGGTAPGHWRSEAHFEWDFRNPAYRFAEKFFSIPGDHCSLAVLRTADAKYVQFAAEADLLPPLLFDLGADGEQVQNVAGRRDHAEMEIEMVQRLLRWRMRNQERTLSNCYLRQGHGPVWARDEWR